jgi:hypothetical protein
MIGAKREAIEMAEDRKLFREAMDRIGLENPKATIVSRAEAGNGKYDIEAGLAVAMAALEEIGLPAIIRPAFTLGGTGGGVAYNREEYEHSAAPAWMPPRWRRSSSTRACWAGRNSRWRSSATRRTTRSSSAPSRTWTRWACIPATRSPWPPR